LNAEVGMRNAETRGTDDGELNAELGMRNAETRGTDNRGRKTDDGEQSQDIK
jgi:hypothetical protein